MADDSGIDPRHPAQFQRGFDPERHAAPEPVPPSAPVKLGGGPPSSAPRVPDPPPLRPVSTSPDRRSRDVDAAQQAEEPAVAEARPIDVRFAALGAALVVAAGIAFSAATTVSVDISMMYDPAAEVPRAAFRALPGPLLASGVLLLALSITPRFRRRGADVLALVGTALVLSLLLIAGLGFASGESVRTQEYWMTGNPTLDQQIEITRAQALVQLVIAAVPWLAVAAAALVALALRAAARRGQAAPASATASRDA